MRLCGLLFAVSFLVLAAAAPAAQAQDERFGIVVHGGTMIPVAQDDNEESGTAFGLRFPVNTGTFLGFEPYIYMGNGKESTYDFGSGPEEREGIDLTSWGANVSFGRLVRPGFHIAPFLGIGNNTLHRESGEISKIGYNAGLELGIAPGKMMINLRGEMNMVDIGESSRKWGLISLGLGYRVTPNF
jgi:hypothetical protein